MASFGVYLDSIALPIVQKVLVGLGFGTVTYIGVSALFTSMQSTLVGHYNTLPSQVAALFYLAGFNTSIGMVLAAWSTYASMLVLKKFQVTSSVP